MQKGLKIGKNCVPLRPNIATFFMIYHYASTVMMYGPNYEVCIEGNFLTQKNLATMAHNIKMEIIAIYKLIIYYFITIYI